MKKTNQYKQPWLQHNQGKSPAWSKGDFLATRHPQKYKNRIIKLLGIIATLSTTATIPQQTKEATPAVTILAATGITYASDLR